VKDEQAYCCCSPIKPRWRRTWRENLGERMHEIIICLREALLAVRLYVRGDVVGRALRGGWSRLLLVAPGSWFRIAKPKPRAGATSQERVLGMQWLTNRRRTETFPDPAARRSVRADAYRLYRKAWNLPCSAAVGGGMSVAELLEGLRDMAKERFGLMARTVLNQWGVMKPALRRNRLQPR